jgi:peptidyl-prolyl cis-trans isomerase SurA
MRYCLFLAALSAGSLFAADISVIDEIICKANGDIITRNDYQRARKQIEDGLRQQGLTGPRLEDALKDAERNILRERIDQLLLISKAKDLNLNVDTEVNKQLAEIQRNIKIADPEKFQQFVREQTGQSYEDYKAELKNQLLTQRVVRQEVSGKIQFKREDLTKYYEEHKNEFQRNERVFLREILVATEGKDVIGLGAAEKKAKDVAARAKKGEKFDELAQSNSDSPSAQQGGEIGAYEKGQLRAELEAAVWTQPRGYVTDPISAGNGFLILKVDDHQKAGLAEFEEVQNEITGKLFQPRMQRARQEHGVGGPGRDQTGDRHQRSCAREIAPQAAAPRGSDSRNQHAEVRHVVFALKHEKSLRVAARAKPARSRSLSGPAQRSSPEKNW